MTAVAEAYFVSRTMQAMEVLAFQPATAPEVAAQLQVHPRTARRLLNRLVADGWLTRSEGRRRVYAPTMRIVALAAQHAARAPLAVLAVPEVDALHAVHGGTAHLFIPSYRSTLCLVHRGGPENARPALRELIPAHAVAAGRVLLAHRPAWRESVFELPLERLTDRTIVEPSIHRETGPLIVERGYGWDAGEYRSDRASVAAPVAAADGDVVAALSVTLEAGSPAGQELHRAGELVARYARRLSSALSAAATSSGSERSVPR